MCGTFGASETLAGAALFGATATGGFRISSAETVRTTEAAGAGEVGAREAEGVGAGAFSADGSVTGCDVASTAGTAAEGAPSFFALAAPDVSFSECLPLSGEAADAGGDGGDVAAGAPEGDAADGKAGSDGDAGIPSGSVSSFPAGAVSVASSFGGGVPPTVFTTLDNGRSAPT